MVENDKIIDAIKKFGQSGSGKATEFVKNELKREALIKRGLALLMFALIVVGCVKYLIV